MPEGFSETLFDQNAILNRADLINAAGSGAIGLTTAMVPYLTHATQFRNAPAWMPTNVEDSTINYGDDANDPDSANRFVPNVRFTESTSPFDPDDDILYYKDDGTIGERQDVNAGEPLVQRRFSLAKLAWIGHDGPNEEAFDSSLSNSDIKDAILACFGLEWDQANFRWNYKAHSTSPNHIMTLEEVAEENRSPNFFELLRAGILSGSLAQHPGEVVGGSSEFLSESQTPEPTDDVVGATGPFFFDDSGSQPSYSADRDLHLIQIGANIIDQADEDSYPTAIYFPAYLADSDAGLYEFYNIAYGVENLPVLNRLYIMGFEDPNDAPEESWSTATNWKSYMIPELWSPHQRPLATSLDPPEHFRLRAYGEVYVRFDPTVLRRAFTGDGSRPDDPLGSVIDYEGDGSDYRDIYISRQDRFWERPTVLEASMIDNSRGKTHPVNYWNSSLPTYDEFNGTRSSNRDKYGYLRFAGFYTGSTPWPKDPNKDPWKKEIAELASGGNGKYFINNQLISNPMVTIVLEVWDEDNSRWLPYSVAPRIATKPAYSNHQVLMGDASIPYDGGLTISGRDTIFTPDPRTDRFAAGFSRRLNGNIINPGGGSWGFESLPERVGGLQLAIEQYYPRDDSTDNDSSFEYPGGKLESRTFSSRANTSQWMVNLEQNPNAFSNSNAFYADLDGVVRPADGFRRDNGTGDGIYLLKEGDLSQSEVRRRPVVLNRPFQSVAELGYVFRDLPGRNLDFWSTESADAALLDFFTVASTPQTISDGINPNSAPPEVLRSVLSNALGQENSEGSTLLSSEEVDLVVENIANYLADEDSLPLENRADLVLLLADEINDALSVTEGLRSNKALAEAPLRALAGVNETRTWNFLIDIVAQSGRLPPTVSSLADFVVEGQQRVWLHVSIDRMTGDVVAYQEEPVYE